MFVLGHLGIGERLCRPWIRPYSLKAFWLGALLPDLLDKTTYYSLCWTTGLSRAALPVIHGTRSFGHTAIFLACCAGLELRKKSPFTQALTWGVISHLILDALSDQLIHFPQLPLLTYLPLLWPLSGDFPVSPHSDLAHHLLSANRPFFLVTELIGGILLFWRTRGSTTSI